MNNNYLKQCTCINCKCVFEIPVKKNRNYRSRDYCSLECRKEGLRVKYPTGTRMSRAWSPEEDELLRGMLTKVHAKQLVKIWNNIKPDKAPERGTSAIFIRIKRLGLSRRCDSVWTSYDLGRKLGICVDRVQKWVDRAWLSTDNYGYDGKRYHLKLISKTYFKDFAVRHPEELWGIGYQKLKLFLGVQLAREISELAVQPTTGRTMVIVRLGTDEVYRSARDAAAVFDISKSTILRNLERDKEIKRVGHFVRLDYPLFWVPSEYRDDFNNLCGQILLKIFCELSSISGYKKTACIVVAVRQSVVIALTAFKKNLKLIEQGEKIATTEAIAEYWYTRFAEKLKHHVNLCSESSRARIRNTLKSITFDLFKNTYKEKALDYFDNFVCDFIYYCTTTYLNKSALPLYFKAQSKLEHADLWTHIEMSCHARLWINDKDKRQKKMSLAVIRALCFLKKNPYFYSFNEEYILHQPISNYPETDNSVLTEILEALHGLSLETSFYELCVNFVNEFLEVGDINLVKQSLELSEEKTQGILSTLRMAAMPF
jgi:hypothetical protein